MGKDFNQLNRDYEVIQNSIFQSKLERQDYEDWLDELDEDYDCPIHRLQKGSDCPRC